MYPELFRIPVLGLPIHSYGLMMAVGVIGVLLMARFLARRSGINPEWFVNAVFVALIAGVIGARGSHVLENLPAYTRPELSAWQNFFNMINIAEGGLTFFGGLLLGTPVMIWYALRSKIPLLPAMDIVGVSLLIALGFGRIGCLLFGCCFGAHTHSPLAITFPYHSQAYLEHYQARKLKPPGELLYIIGDGSERLMHPQEVKRSDPSVQAAAAAERSLPVHPAQIYSSLNAFLIVGALFAYFTLPHAAGQVFALMLVLKGGTRFLLEMLRAEPAVLGPMSLSMVIGAGMVAVGIAFWIFCRQYAARQQPEAAAVPVK